MSIPTGTTAGAGPTMRDNRTGFLPALHALYCHGFSVVDVRGLASGDKS